MAHSSACKYQGFWSRSLGVHSSSKPLQLTSFRAVSNIPRAASATWYSFRVLCHSMRSPQ